MSGPAGRFDPSELRVPGEPDPSAAEQADAMLAARELETLASSATVRPTEGFEDRVMAAIATEPAPRLVVRRASAVRGGLIASFFMTIRESWAVATTGGRPMAVRAQALAFVLLVVVTTGALTGVGAMGVGGLLGRNESPSPSILPAPTVTPEPTSSPSPAVEPSPSLAPSPSESAEPSGSAEPTETPEAAETEKPDATQETETPRPTRTPRPTETPEPADTPEPAETPESTDDDSDSGSGSSDDG